MTSLLKPLLLLGATNLASCASISTIPTPSKEPLEVLLSQERAQEHRTRALQDKTNSAEDLLKYISDSAIALYVEPMLRTPLSLQRETDIMNNEPFFSGFTDEPCAVQATYKMQFDSDSPLWLNRVGVGYCVQDSQVVTGVDLSIGDTRTPSEHYYSLNCDQRGDETRMVFTVHGLVEKLAHSGFTSSRSIRSKYDPTKGSTVVVGKRGNEFYLLTPAIDLLPYAKELLDQRLAGSEVVGLLELGSFVRTKYGSDNWFKETVDVTSIQEKQQQVRQLDSSLNELEREFTEEIRAHDSYASFITNPNFTPLFTHYPYLTHPFIAPNNLSTSISDPKALNLTLEKIHASVQRLPRSYQQRLHNSPLYISGSPTDIATLCEEEQAVACFDSRTKDIYFVQASNYQQDTPHELAHAHFSSLPISQQKGLVDIFSLFVQRPEVQDDAIENNNGYFVWSKEKRDGPKYSCPRPYSARNEYEYMATYIEDIMGNEGKDVITLLKGEYRPDVVTTLETLREWEFFGNKEETNAYLTPIYQRAGLGNAALEKLKRDVN